MRLHDMEEAKRVRERWDHVTRVGSYWDNHKEVGSWGAMRSPLWAIYSFKFLISNHWPRGRFYPIMVLLDSYWIYICNICLGQKKIVDPQRSHPNPILWIDPILSADLILDLQQSSQPSININCCFLTGLLFIQYYICFR